MSVVVRFAPSPTGFLHIGGARTALFNWLFARHRGGLFLLRIEDTDRARSTAEAVTAILEGLRWLGLTWDGEVVYQFARAGRHGEVARDLLTRGAAYRCFATPTELEEMRAVARAAGRFPRYDGRWRDRDPADAPAGAPFVIRLKAPHQGETVIRDRIQGEIRVANEELDDMVLLRADGTPTYMLSVVVDDHDMGISHIIRGTDHLTNAFRQTLIYQALGWNVPEFAHIPLIHGPDGAKLSKRHGAIGVEAYRDMGYLPEAMRNYLLRLGWSHGDEEVISTEQAIEWFDLDHVGKSAARFDFAKLGSVNNHYLKVAEDSRLVAMIAPLIERDLGVRLSEKDRYGLLLAMPYLKPRAKTLLELAKSVSFFARPASTERNPQQTLIRQELHKNLSTAAWTTQGLDQAIADTCRAAALPTKDVAQEARLSVTGSTVSPPLTAVFFVLGRDETLARLAATPAPAERAQG
ncbi:MAG: glutamate--tRNA ligase [Rhodospirillaceae bacterium]|nr:glutamate--tRNA ligase [Rhodospirillaceae bacterium]